MLGGSGSIGSTFRTRLILVRLWERMQWYRRPDILTATMLTTTQSQTSLIDIALLHKGTNISQRLIEDNACREPVADATRALGSIETSTHRAQYPLIEQYTLNYKGLHIMV